MNSVVVLGPDLKKTYTGPQTPDQINIKAYRNVTCYPPEGMIFKGLKPIALDQITKQRIKYRFPWRNLLPVKKYKKKSVLLLTGKNHASFGHYFLEQFPRLLRFLKFKESESIKDFDILASKGNYNHIRQIIKIFDLEVNKIHTLKNIPLKFEELFYVNPPSNAYKMFNQTDFVILKKLLSNLHFNSQSSLSENLFLTRTNAPRRRLINEIRVFDIFKDYLPDIEMVDLGQFSLLEQIKIIKNTKVLVGPNGQSFASSIFGQKILHNIVLSPCSPPPFSWACKFASISTLLGGQGSVLYSAESTDRSFHQDWQYSEKALHKQLEQVSLPATRS